MAAVPSGRSPFQAQPAGVAGITEQLGFMGGGGGFGCTPSTQPDVYLALGQTTIELPFAASICLSGFPPGGELDVRVRGPNFSVYDQRVVIADNGVGALEWIAVPDEAEGLYAAEVELEGRVLGAEWEERRPAEPRLELFPQLAPAGTTLFAMLAGAAPDAPLEVDVTFSALDAPAAAVTTLTLEADTNGAAVLELPTSARDPAGQYWFSIRQAEQAGPHAYVELTAPPRPLLPRIGERPPSVLARRAAMPASDNGFSWRCERRAGPVLSVAPAEVRIGSGGDICVNGLHERAGVTAVVEAPDGSTERYAVALDDGAGLVPFVPRPGAALGTYTVTIEDAPGPATATFSVVAADSDTIVAPSPSGPPGTSFEVWLAGYEPGQAVPLHIVRDVSRGGLLCQGEWTGRYISSLPPVTVDARGEAVVTLPSSADDQPARYSVGTVNRIEGSPRDNVTLFAEITIEQPQPPSAVATPEHVQPGSAVEVRFAHLSPDDCLDPRLFRLDGGSLVPSVSPTYVLTEADGAATYRFWLPEDLLDGEYALIAGDAVAWLTVAR